MGFSQVAAAGGGGCATSKCFPMGWGLMARLCDYCNSAPALIYCRTDSTYTCMECDNKVHVTHKSSSRHERVWVCEVCEQAPASVTCKADAAALCVTCDHDIHSANPLAQRHERIPVVPFYDAPPESLVKASAANCLVFVDQSENTSDTGHGHYMMDTWSSENITAPKVSIDSHAIKSTEFQFSEPDNYLDYDYPISSGTGLQQYFSSATDGVVPVHAVKSQIPAQLFGLSSEKHFQIDFAKPHLNSHNHGYAPQSLAPSVSSSSLEFGVVPEGSSISEISCTVTGELGGSSGRNQASQMVGMDREARVLRYREKRKNRKFEKTIRYASRKAYAETRPRIKGRFAKRSEDVQDPDNVTHMFCPDSAVDLFPESRYGVVPSF